MSLISVISTALLIAALLASPCELLAQRGAGGGHSGGGAAGGGGLSGGGRATGLSEKDDLKDFHLALALQATSQQIVAYNLMLKSTDAATAELQTFVAVLAKQNSSSEIAGRNAALSQSIATARTLNSKFLEALSEQQKSGLKEIIKKLTKTGSDLAQQNKALDLELRDAKPAAQPIAGSAQSLERALAAFRTEQIGLGEEMSIGMSNSTQDSFALAPVKRPVNFPNHPIAITTSGVITKAAAESGQSTFKLELTEDLSDLQQDITGVLRVELDQSDPCGEHVAIQSATLASHLQASVVVVQLHYERWACLGRQTINELVEGNGTLEVKLTPSVADDGSLHLLPEIGRVDAETRVGDLLRSGSLGEMLRDKITATVLSALRQGGDFKMMLPPAAQGSTTLRHAQFESTGSGRLLVQLEGDIRIPEDKASVLLRELQARSSQASSQDSPQEILRQTPPR